LQKHAAAGGTAAVNVKNKDDKPGANDYMGMK